MSATLPESKRDNILVNHMTEKHDLYPVKVTLHGFYGKNLHLLTFKTQCINWSGGLRNKYFVCITDYRGRNFTSRHKVDSEF
jgi:hypothetical protein